MKVKLETPVLVSNEEVSEIELKVPTVKDIKDIDIDDGVGMAIKLLSRIATPQFSEIEVEQITVPDFMRITEVISGFFATTKG